MRFSQGTTLSDGNHKLYCLLVTCPDLPPQKHYTTRSPPQCNTRLAASASAPTFTTATASDCGRTWPTVLGSPAGQRTPADQDALPGSAGGT